MLYSPSSPDPRANSSEREIPPVVPVLKGAPSGTLHSLSASGARFGSVSLQDTIDAGSVRLQAPKIKVVERRSGDERKGITTIWETPYNRPGFEGSENTQYTKLAAQYLQQGRIEDAECLYNLALLVAERTFAKMHPTVLKAVEDLAWFYFSHERYSQAEPLVARLLEERVERLDCHDKVLIRTVDQLAEIYQKSGKGIEAQALYRFLLARQEEVLGRHSITCAVTLNRLADLYLHQGQYQSAEALMLRILEIQENVYGRSSIEISTTLQQLSLIYYHLGSLDKSAEMLERLLHILEAIHGPNGLSVASCLLRLADLLSEFNMPQEAEPLYRRAQDIYRRSYGDSTAAHSLFAKKLEHARKPVSKASRDIPIEQVQCASFPAMMPPNLEELLPCELGTVQPSRCLGHGQPDGKWQSTREMEKPTISNRLHKPLFTPEPFPTSRRKSNAQAMFPVARPR